MKKLQQTGLFLVLLACVLLIVYLFTWAPKETSDEIRIAAILPLGGNSALAAKQAQEGIQLAVDSINSVVGGRKIEVVFEDSKSKVSEAVAAYRRMESLGIKTFLVHGGQFVMGIAPLTKGTDEVVAAVSTPNPNATKVTDRLIRVSPLAEVTVDILAQYAIDSLRAKKGAIIYVNNEAYRLYNDLFIKRFSEFGGDVVFSEGCTENMRDFKDIVTKVGKAKPDFVFVASIGEQVGIITNQLLQNPLLSGIPILGNMNMGNPSVKKSINPNGAVIRYADVKIAPFYNALYENKLNSKPNSLSAQAFSAVMVLYQSICNATTGDDQLDYIKNTSFNTAVTPLSFDESGECCLEMMIYDF